MLSNKQQNRARLAVILAVISILTLITLLFGLAWPLLLTKAGPTLPPRRPPPAAPEDDDDDDTVTGAYIELQVQPPQSGLWAGVQWQDSAGQWQAVEGWQAALDAAGYRRWWVAPKDFGKGQFRWIVTRGAGGTLLGSSPPFSLPAGANQTVRIELSLGQ